MQLQSQCKVTADSGSAANSSAQYAEESAAHAATGAKNASGASIRPQQSADSAVQGTTGNKNSFAAVETEDTPDASTGTAIGFEHVIDDEPRTCDLPDFDSAAEPTFRWGRLDGKDFAHTVHCAYNEIVHWRRNVFMVPSGKTGKAFIKELTSLLASQHMHRAQLLNRLLWKLL